MNKIKITRTISHDALKKLELIAKLNNMNESQVLDILIKKQKKLQLFWGESAWLKKLY